MTYTSRPGPSLERRQIREAVARVEGPRLGAAEEVDPGDAGAGQVPRVALDQQRPRCLAADTPTSRFMCRWAGWVRCESRGLARGERRLHAAAEPEAPGARPAAHRAFHP